MSDQHGFGIDRWVILLTAIYVSVSAFLLFEMSKDGFGVNEGIAVFALVAAFILYFIRPILEVSRNGQ